jgi:hypothetical protein
MVEKKRAKLNEFVPSMKLRTYVHVLNSLEVLGNHTKAERITGVKRQTFYYHLNKNPKFEEWYLKESRNIFKKNITKTVYSTQNQANQGNMIAAEKIFKMIGWLGDDKSEQNVNVNVTPNREFKISSIIDHGDNGNGTEGTTDDMDAGQSIASDRFKQKI